MYSIVFSMRHSLILGHYGNVQSKSCTTPKKSVQLILEFVRLYFYSHVRYIIIQSLRFHLQQVKSEQLNLLKHPVVGSLLHYKWRKFGQYGYFFNLVTYIIFLAVLTAFALVVFHPLDDSCESMIVVKHLQLLL